jgi:hypothetical protein
MMRKVFIITIGPICLNIDLSFNDIINLSVSPWHDRGAVPK